MSYTALYRKFRPTVFEDVKGQDPIVATLRNQIVADRIGHAYLFCGTRGTGKTSVAKIFAKAVNCLTPENGSPCGHCEMCQGIASGSVMNVIEIDAASNNGVDNIREIREEVAYSPARGRFKVYIIDEVHMLSTGAFNALLKTLEEPPPYVIFILATTEVHKIPITILSRCQQYDFRRIAIEDLAARIHQLLTAEQVEAEEKAVRYIAKVADGSMRDALSLLDQCIAFYYGKKLTYEQVLEVLGAVDTDTYSLLLEQIIQRDVGGVLAIVEELIMAGRELSQLVQDFIWYLRNLLLVKASASIKNETSSKQLAEVLEVTEEHRVKLETEATQVEMNQIIWFINVLSEVSNQLRFATQKRVLLEVALIKLCRPAMETSQEALFERIRVVEDNLEKGNYVSATAQMAAGMTGKMTSANEHQRDNGGVHGQFGEQKTTPSPTLSKAVPAQVQKAADNFRSIVMTASPLIRGFLKNARLSLGGDNRLLIVLGDATEVAYLSEANRIEEIEQLLTTAVGGKVEIELRLMETGKRFDDIFVDIENKINMEITVEED